MKLFGLLLLLLCLSCTHEAPRPTPPTPPGLSFLAKRSTAAREYVAPTQIMPRIQVSWRASVNNCRQTGLQASQDLLNWTEVVRLPYTEQASVILSNRPAREFYRPFYVCDSAATNAIPVQCEVKVPKIDLRLALNRSVEGLYSNKTVAQWEWLTGRTNCWIHPVDMTGLSLYHYPAYNSGYLGGKFISANIALITRRHALSAAHMMGSLTNLLAVFGTQDGRFITNLVVAITNQYNDISIVTLASNVPPEITPFAVFPPNFTNYFASNSFQNTKMVWYRNNTKRMNVLGTSYTLEPRDMYGTYLYCNLRYTNETVFSEDRATAGDSSGPIFWVLDGVPVLGCSVLGSSPNGPFISASLDFVRQQIGTNRLRYADMSKYERYR